MKILSLPTEIYKGSIPTLESADLYGRKVILRADLDVSIEDGKIREHSRLNSLLPTVDYLLGKGCSIVICGHMGRPDGKDEKLSLLPVAKWFKKRFLVEHQNHELIKIGGFEGWQIGEKIQLLENLRFYKEEEENDKDFAKKLSLLADIYINDAFGVSHRAHASIVGVPKFLPHYPGLRLEAEVAELTGILEIDKWAQRHKELNHKNLERRPLTIIIGGAKIETKLPLVEKMHKFADSVLVGGEIAENDKVLAKVAHEKLTDKKSILLVADLTSDNKDITEVSTQNFIQIINISKTIVWNGPMGEFEKCFDLGTREIAKAIASSSAHTIVGGGDTISFIEKEGLVNKFSFVSVGGGAMLEFLAGEKLPGLLALTGN